MIKIAAATDDGKTLSRHFGRAARYLVLTVQDGQITDQELRSKLAHAELANHQSEPPVASQPHVLSRSAQHRHARIFANIQDCKVLLSGDMENGDYQSLLEAGIQPVVTHIQEIEKAVQAYLDGSIIIRVELLH